MNNKCAVQFGPDTNMGRVWERAIKHIREKNPNNWIVDCRLHFVSTLYFLIL